MIITTQPWHITTSEIPTKLRSSKDVYCKEIKEEKSCAMGKWEQSVEVKSIQTSKEDHGKMKNQVYGIHLKRYIVAYIE